MRPSKEKDHWIALTELHNDKLADRHEVRYPVAKWYLAEMKQAGITL
jgi:hypothetical protein